MVGNRFPIRLLLTVLWIVPGGSIARAGGGPENVFLVVNPASWASQAVANHFIELRHIPPINVYYLPWTGGFESIDGDTFRAKILSPTLDLVEKRHLFSQIDYVVYSSDFPYSIDISRDFPKVKFPDQMRPGCSLSSATYLWHLVMSKNPILMDLHINHYMRIGPGGRLPSHGFRSWYGWTTSGELAEAGGQPYMLSTMLAMTSGRGNSVTEAIRYLTASAAADGTQPKGKIFYSKTNDVRSTARAGGFAEAVKDLKDLGVAAEIISASVPTNRPNVQGAMLGAADFSWGQARSKILGGAICESLTSFGGILGEGASQTPLSEFLRYGAAGSSGTIIEPYAIREKFPDPQIHVHYARGCSLAESYYQSVFGPAQLLIVGDPLARPWAEIPRVQIGGVKSGEKVSGTVSLKSAAKLANGGPIDHFEWFVDGKRVAVVDPGRNLEWDSTTEGDGYHELRVVAVEASAIETQGRAIMPLVVDNHGRSATLATEPAKTARWGETLKLRASAPGMKQVYLLYNGFTVGKIDGEEGEFSIDPRRFGTGPITLQAVGTTSEGARTWAYSPPVSIVVEPNKPLPAIKSPSEKLLPGLVLKLPDGKLVSVPDKDIRDPGWLGLLGVGSNEPFAIQGYFDVATEDVYQFQLWHYGDVKLTVDGSVVHDGKNGNNTQQFVATALATGLHRLSITGHTADDVKLRVLFGGPGAQSLSSARFKHAR